MFVTEGRPKSVCSSSPIVSEQTNKKGIQPWKFIHKYLLILLKLVIYLVHSLQLPQNLLRKKVFLTILSYTLGE